MSDLPFTLINGDVPSWSDVEVHAGGIQYTPYFKELKYSDELSRALQYGAGARPIGKTLGQLKPEASAVMFKTGWEHFKTYVLGGNGFMRKRFQILAAYGAEGGPTYRDSLLHLNVVKVEGGGSAGGDGAEVTLTLMPLGILWNGHDALGSSLGSLPIF